ncbi:MAG: hypothetical protein M1835_003514 [Candelina submexicana]|nr:MAG: hypothetical protein M1835_003514 [Candelina submexicana]
MLTNITNARDMNGTNEFEKVNTFPSDNHTMDGQQPMNEEDISPELEVTGTNDESNTFYPKTHLNGIISNGNIREPSTDSTPKGTGAGRDVDFDLADIADGHGEAPPLVAIVGMGMRLPGRVSDESAFWELLVNKKTFYNPDGGPGTVKTKYGYFLGQVNLQHLDTSFFSMNRSEVERLDPQQRLLLEVIWECMENGGQVGWRGKKIGCYVGLFGEDWLDMAANDTQHLGMYCITGSGDFAFSNRISYEYDLKGPSITIRTACSSSLIGLHEACQAIYRGECDSALVAGTNLIITPTMTIAMTEQGVLSPTGSGKSFDANADGYARGEAINAVYIKKLSDVLRDGDPVRAVIRATATDCDGKTPGMACPSSESHEAVIRRAYRVAQLQDLSKTAFMECHGTGTAIGDPLETAAIAKVFGRSGLFIGSHKIIPPNINFHIPNPKSRTFLTGNCEQSRGNNFGSSVREGAASGTNRSHTMARWSGKSQRELVRHRRRKRPSLETSPFIKTRTPSQVTFVFTGQGAQWAGMAKQLMLDFAESREDIKMMNRVLTGLPRPPMWTMEEELAEGKNTSHIDEAEFSQPLCAAVQVALINLLKSWGVSPAAIIGHSSGEIAAAYASNAITAKSAIIIAYYHGQVSKKQTRPGGMLAVGMSQVAITPYLMEGLVVACENSAQSVTLSSDRKQISKVAQTIANKDSEIFIRHLKVGVAYHSSKSLSSVIFCMIEGETPSSQSLGHMKDIGDEYLAFLNGHVSTNLMEIPFFSTVTGELMVDERQLGSSYWQRNLESPVRFYSAVRAILEQPSLGTIFLEVGPHAALSGPLKQTFKAITGDRKPVYVPSLVRNGNSTANLLTAMGQLHLLNVPINF